MFLWHAHYLRQYSKEEAEGHWKERKFQSEIVPFCHSEIKAFFHYWSIKLPGFSNQNICYISLMLSLSIILDFAISKCAYWGIIALQNDSRMRLFPCRRPSEDFQLLWDHTVGLLSALSKRHTWKTVTHHRPIFQIVFFSCKNVMHAILYNTQCGNEWQFVWFYRVFLGQRFPFSAKGSQILSIVSYISLILQLAKISLRKTRKSTILRKKIQNIWEEEQGK